MKESGTPLLGLVGIALSSFAILLSLLLLPLIYSEISEMEAEINEHATWFKKESDQLWEDVRVVQERSKRQSPIGDYYYDGRWGRRASFQQSISNVGNCVCKATNTCPPGLPGNPGTPGLDAAPGSNGLPGKPGQSGAIFPQISKEGCLICPAAMGLPGLRGQPGLPGMKGMPGFSLLNTFSTDQGLPGPPGPVGDEGERGGPGVQGRFGNPGLDNYMRPSVRGPKGEPGRVGRAGLMGPPGKDNSSVGPPGRSGPPGRPGASGAHGTDGFQGLPGDVGEPGNDAAYCLCPRRSQFLTNFHLQRRNWFH